MLQFCYEHAELSRPRLYCGRSGEVAALSCRRLGYLLDASDTPSTRYRCPIRVLRRPDPLEGRSLSVCKYVP
jgi:hypothetical protein